MKRREAFLIKMYYLGLLFLSCCGHVDGIDRFQGDIQIWNGFGVVNKNIADIQSCSWVMSSCLYNGPGDQSKATHCQKSHHNVFSSYSATAVRIPPISIVTHFSGKYGLHSKSTQKFLCTGQENWSNCFQESISAWKLLLKERQNTTHFWHLALLKSMFPWM